MDTVTAVRNRILTLCGEREITINKLATISALPPSSIKNILSKIGLNYQCLKSFELFLLKWNFFLIILFLLVFLYHKIFD